MFLVLEFLFITFGVVDSLVRRFVLLKRHAIVSYFSSVDVAIDPKGAQLKVAELHANVC